MKSPKYERVITGQNAQWLCSQCPNLYPTVPALERHVEMNHPQVKRRGLLRRR